MFFFFYAECNQCGNERDNLALYFYLIWYHQNSAEVTHVISKILGKIYRALHKSPKIRSE